MRLKKSLGQHILISRGVCQAIAEFLNPEEEDVLIEIGPGTGSLTIEVLKFNFKRLHLVEIDQKMLEKLLFIEDKRVYFHHADATSFDFCSLNSEVRVFGNLPYCAWSGIIVNFILHKNCIKDGLFLLQKEVAQNLQKESSLMSVFVRSFFKVEYLMTVPGRFFRPVPRVQSGLIRLQKHKDTELDLKSYLRFLKEVFKKPKAQLCKKLDAELLESLGIEPTKRVHELKPEDFLRLFLEGGQRGELPPRL
ncbi:MAG: 16S rRNA (adenine(1518)-N(6)/adenine(1519)-N(6))-dimethyltransferase RsmA [Aquificaceae bacterium]